MCEGNQMRFMPRLVLRRLVLPWVVLPRIVAVSSLATLIVAVTLVVPGEPAVAVVPSVWMVANSVATGDQDAPAVAANRVGDVAVVWEDDRDSTNPADNTHSEIYLRRFRNGVSSYEVKLSAGGTSGASWKHVTPDVGLDDRGNAVVVWADDPDGNGFYNIPYRVVSPAGSVIGSGYANASTAGQQLAPKVSVDPDGAPGSSGIPPSPRTSTVTSSSPGSPTTPAPQGSGHGRSARTGPAGMLRYRCRPRRAPTLHPLPSTTRATPWSAGRSAVPTRRSGPVASTRTAPRSVGCRASRSAR